MIRSMTGFASQTGAFGAHSWSWELRSVNGKGLDLRVRVPDWLGGFEAAARKMLGAQIARGNVTLGLRITREESAGTLSVNEPHLNTLLSALHRIEERAMDEGLSLAPSTATDIAVMRGVLEQAVHDDDNDALAKVLADELPGLIDDFNAMRASEGAAIAKMLDAQLAQIAQLTADAANAAEKRSAEMAETLRRNLARVIENTENVDEDRVAQEIALIAIKADITEEIDRLNAHVAAAKELLSAGGPVGRKLDFLMQEFNREANTLCSKAQHSALTRIGLDMKSVIDQMREQVQNME